MDEHKECKETEEELVASIQELERAVSVLTGSNPDWRYNVSNGDVTIIDKILEKLNAWSE